MSKPIPNRIHQPSQRSGRVDSFSPSVRRDSAQGGLSPKPDCLDDDSFSDLDLPSNSSILTPDSESPSSPDLLKLLLVEDDEDDYILIKDLLADMEEPVFELDWVTSFRAALDMLEREAHDAYLVDYRLGARDGLELMTQIQARRPAPVIILSGQGNRELDIAALKQGASDYLDKSNLHASLLEHYIRASIKRNEALQALKESEQRYRKLFKQERLLRRQLSESNAELEQFAFIASHDLREPLRAIAGHAQLLADDYSDLFDETATEYMAFITDGVERMQTLIRDLLGFSRLQSSPIDPSTKADCNQALQTALTNLQSAVVESNAVIVCETLPTVVGDLSQIARLFQNLIDNAIKFSQPDVQPHVNITVKRAGLEKSSVKSGPAGSGPAELGKMLDERASGTDPMVSSGEPKWQFSVSDNGVGIEPQYFDYIFKAFKRLHSQKEVSGTGIGLATCQHIVQRHGGTLWLESALGRGSTFHFTLRNSG